MGIKWNGLVWCAALTAFGCCETGVYHGYRGRGYSETDEWDGAPIAIHENEIVEAVRLRMDKADVLSLKGVPTTVVVTKAGNIRWIYESEGRTVIEFGSNGRVCGHEWSAE